VAAPRGNGGRPKGATKGKDFNCTVAIIAAKNEVAMQTPLAFPLKYFASELREVA